MNLLSFSLKVIIFILTLNLNAFSEIIEDIKIDGNQRISNDTIKLFSKIDIGDEINNEDINRILKDLYETNFFENINVSLEKETLVINVVENPIIENIFYKGVKSNNLLNKIKNDSSIKSRSSFNENLIKKEKKKLKIF